LKVNDLSSQASFHDASKRVNAQSKEVIDAIMTGFLFLLSCCHRALKVGWRFSRKAVIASSWSSLGTSAAFFSLA
jgi:hypothetical protein